MSLKVEDSQNFSMNFIASTEDLIEKFQYFFSEIERIKKRKNLKRFLECVNTDPYFNYKGVYKEVEFNVGLHSGRINLSVYWEEETNPECYPFKSHEEFQKIHESILPKFIDNG